jgi:hypothetical protein
MAERLSTHFRLMGFLPLTFFLAQTIHYWRYGGSENLLWMCNVGNLLLAIGLFLSHKELIRAAAIWTIPGLGIWFQYVLLANGNFFSSTLAHVGGIIVGLIVLSRVRMDRIAWLYSFVWYLFMQLAARLTTPATMNVNLAHKVQDGWKHTFSAYWKFWIVLTVTVAAGLWTIGMVLSRIWPARDNESRAAGSADVPSALSAQRED